MSNELKYEVGQEVLLKVRISSEEDNGEGYIIELPNGEIRYVQKESLVKNHCDPIHNKTRAIMAATIYSGLVHLIETSDVRIKTAVKHTDKLISELNIQPE